MHFQGVLMTQPSVDTGQSGYFVPLAAMPGWSWGKFVDLLMHLWVPVVVIGTSGTAAMITE